MFTVSFFLLATAATVRQDWRWKLHEAIRCAYAERGMAVTLAPGELHAGYIDPAADYTLVEARADRLHGGTRLKLTSNGNRSMVVRTDRALPRYALPATELAEQSARVRAGAECDVISPQSGVDMHLAGIALRGAAVGSETRVRLTGFENRVVRARVIGACTLEVMP